MSQVLIVDDSRSIRELLGSVLASAGFKVTSANDGQQGLDTARTQNFDLVITDINMPVMNGLRLQTDSDPHHRVFPGDEIERQGGWRHRLDGQALRSGEDDRRNQPHSP